MSISAWVAAIRCAILVASLARVVVQVRVSVGSFIAAYAHCDH